MYNSACALVKLLMRKSVSLPVGQENLVMVAVSALAAMLLMMKSILRSKVLFNVLTSFLLDSW